MGPPAFAPQGLPIREYLLVGLSAAVVTFLITGVVRRLAIRAGAIAVPRGRDVHTVPIPRLGGVGIYLGVVAGVFVASQLPVLRRAFDYSYETMAVLVAGGLIVLVGALDDRFGLDALTKLAGQATAAGVLVLMGVQWSAVYVPWGGSGGSTGSVLLLGQDQGVLITVFLCVVLINAMNFVDGLDGLAAGIGLIAATATCAFSRPAQPGERRRQRLSARADRRGAGRGLRRLPAPQLPTGAPVHGRLRVDVHRADPRRGHHHGVGAHRLREHRLARGAGPDGPADRGRRGGVRPFAGPPARRGAPDPGGHQPVRPGQDAPAPSVARDRPLAAPARCC